MNPPSNPSKLNLQIFMAAARLRLLLQKNATSNSVRLFSSSAALVQRPWTHYTDDSDVSDGESDVYKNALKFQRPTTVKKEDISPNSVSLIGEIYRPFRETNSDRFGIHTMIRVVNAPNGLYRNFRILLHFRDELAEMSVKHLKLNDLVYVLGRLGSYVKEDENGKASTFYKVDVSEVNFVNRNGLGPAYHDLVKFDPQVSMEDIKQKRRDRLHLWQIFFASPFEWWDNRNRKLNPKMPDFKHKDTGEVLWLGDNDPPWVHKQLKLHDSRLYRRSPGEHRNALSCLSPLVFE